jgi:transposase-like protein
VHVDSCELRSAEGEVHLFLAVDRVTKFTYVEVHDRADTMAGAAFLAGVVAAFPYRLHTVLTDNGVAFCNCASTKWDWRVHVFDRVCREHGVEHRRTTARRSAWSARSRTRR